MPFGDDRNLPAWMRLIREPQHSRVEKERLGQPGGFIAPPMGIPERAQITAGPSESDTPLPPWQFSQLLDALWRRNNVFMQPFLAGAVPILLRPAEKRQYLFIQNQSAANQFTIGINQAPDPPAAVPANGLIIPINLGFYEPLVVPQGEIWVVAAAANTPGVLLYSA